VVAEAAEEYSKCMRDAGDNEAEKKLCSNGKAEREAEGDKLAKQAAEEGPAAAAATMVADIKVIEKKEEASAMAKAEEVAREETEAVAEAKEEQEILERAIEPARHSPFSPAQGVIMIACLLSALFLCVCANSRICSRRRSTFGESLCGGGRTWADHLFGFSSAAAAAASVSRYGESIRAVDMIGGTESLLETGVRPMRRESGTMHDLSKRSMSVTVFDEAETIGVSHAGVLQDSVKEPQSFGLGIHEADH